MVPRDVSYRKIQLRKILVDSFHRKPWHREPRTGKDCQFCQSFDSDFGKRVPMDKLVYAELNDDATAHITGSLHRSCARIFRIPLGPDEYRWQSRRSHLIHRDRIDRCAPRVGPSSGHDGLGYPRLGCALYSSRRKS
jgi:hypothetical protein